MSDSPQHALWNGPSGHAWVQAQALLDRMFAALAAHLADAVELQWPGQVLDVGCGTGAVSLAIAARLGPGGHCTGVDISAPMIRCAAQRVAGSQLPVSFAVADAQQPGLAPAALDRIVSRFGVMFFDQPVRAFANLRQATRAGGALQALAWRDAGQNPFMTTAERAAAPLLALPTRAPDAPGQFAFADARRVTRILADSGWDAIELVPVDARCTISITELRTYLGLLGPVGAALRDPQMDPGRRAEILAVVEQAFAPFVSGDEVSFTAACWELRAVAP